MRKSRSLPAAPLAAVFAAWLLAGCQPPPAGDEAAAGTAITAEGGLRYGQLAFEPCALSTPGLDAVEAQCTTLAVPENHAEPDGRRIELAIAWIPARGEGEPDPIFMIAGGPGQSALESYPMLHGAFSDARRNRHVLLVDARGTGGSHPLSCKDEEGENAFIDEENPTPEAARAFAERCLDQLDDDSDLRFYTTTDHVQDLDLVRERVGAEQVNLIGVSYGTRVAQQYAARYPEHTRTVTLDSVVPNTLALGGEHARNLEDALTEQFSRCRATEACLRNLGDPAENLAKVRTTLQVGNMAPVRFRDPVSGEWRSESPAFGDLAILLRMYAYQPAAAATLPLLLSEAANGHYEPLLAQSRMLLDNVSDTIMHGMQLSVMCTEDYPELQASPDDAGTVLGTDLVDFSRAQCAVWPQGERPAGFREPLTGDVPVLAVTGELDPVTPPRYGDAVVEHLPNGRHLVLAGQGHSVLGAGCMPELFAQFLETADAKSLDADCLSRLRATPPFAGHYGWEP